MAVDQPDDADAPEEGGDETQDASRDGFVSIWLAPEITEQEIDDYLAEVEDFDPDGENEEAFSRFAEEFGLQWYDSETAMEAALETQAVPVRQLLNGASFAASFLDNADAAAKQAGVTTAQAAILLYDVAYDPAFGGATTGERFVFLGAFPYVADDEDAE